MNTGVIKCANCGKDAGDEVRQAASQIYRVKRKEIDDLLKMLTDYAASGGNVMPPDVMQMEEDAKAAEQNLLRAAQTSYVCLHCREKRS